MKVEVGVGVEVAVEAGGRGGEVRTVAPASVICWSSACSAAVRSSTRRTSTW